MSINLTPQVEQRIRDWVENGPYADADAVVDNALRALEERERAKFVKLRELVRAGIESGNLREFTPELEDEIAREADEADRRDLPVRRLLDVEAMDRGPAMSLSNDEGDTRSFADARGHKVSEMKKNNEEPQESLGVVTGRLQAISTRGSLRITVYDIVNDRAIRCLLSDAQRDQARELWDQIVEVEGIIKRDPASGDPISIRQVSRIALAQKENARERWMSAGGVLRRLAPDVPSEVLIRRLRDA
jgi:putative addiction module CopG family antidote